MHELRRKGGMRWESGRICLFLILDTNTDYGEGSPQQQWLRSQLQSARQGQRRWLWVAFHHPAYSEGWSPCEQDGDEGVRSQLIPLLEEAGVNVVFNGHVHGYERGMLHGVHYVTTGGGGGILDKSCGDWPHISVARYEHHFATVDVHGTEAYVVAHAIDGTILDSFTVSQGSGS